MKTIKNSNIGLQVLLLACGLAIAIFFAACSSPSGGPGSSIAWKNAKQGNVYIFKDYQIDTLGRLGIPTVEVDSVVTSGLSIGGKANASEVLESVVGNFSLFSYYIAYDANGDFELGDSSYSAPNGFMWIDFPTGTQRTNVIRDTSGDNGYDKFSEYQAISYVGYESVQAAGKTFNAMKIKLDSRSSSSSTNYSDASETVEYFWFVPEIGFFVKAEMHDTSSSDSNGYKTSSSSGGMFVLDSYSLK
jgi:hypothetical protein